MIKSFFLVKISTLGDILPDNNSLSNTLLFNVGSIALRKFSDSISYSMLNAGSQTPCSMMFPKDQFDTKMGIGLMGSPNIGSIVLNQSRDLRGFKQFSNVLQENDRTFIVNGISGETGAAGYPIIAKNICNAGNNVQINNRGDLRDAGIGTLTVLLYLNVQQDENSPISWADFISKTRSALFYHHDNLTETRQNGVDLSISEINACYCPGNEIPNNSCFNDPGGNGQHNDAHAVEYADALTALDFLQIPDDQLLMDSGNAVNLIYKEYGLADDKMTLSLKDFGISACLHVNKQLAGFHLTYLYITRQLKNDVGHGYTEDKPEITSGSLSISFSHTLINDFYMAYLTQLRELKLSQHSFEPFHLTTDKLSDTLNGIAPKNGLPKSTVDYKLLLSSLNRMSQQAVKTQKYGIDRAAHKLMNLLDETLNKLVEERYNSVVQHH